MEQSGEGEIRVQEKFRVYRQHVRQQQYQQLNCEDHFCT